MHDQISVVIPCFNEGGSIYRNIAEIHSYLEDNFRDFEIIAVNDGSTDDTLAELDRARQDFSIEIIDNPANAGKGKAVRDGIMRGRYGLVMFLDADLAIPIEELEEFATAISQGCDIAIASRFVPGLKVKTPVLWYRKIMERGFRLLRKIILNSWKIEDTQCGFKVFRRDVARKIFSKATVNRFAFDAEIIFIAKKLGYAIKELPVTLQNPQTTHIRLFYDPLNMLIALLEIRYNDLSGIYRWKQKKEEKKLVISADDFGISRTANDSILALAEARKLDRVAVMADGTFNPEDIARLKKSGVKLDIHLDSTHSPSSARKLKESVLLRTLVFFSKNFPSLLDAGSEKSRWEEQLEKFHSLFGRAPDGLNSHHHIHFFPTYFKAVARLAQENGIPFVRFGKKSLVRHRGKVYFILYWLRKMDLESFRASRLESSDHMFSLDWPEDIRETLARLPEGTTEIVCHPERKNEFELIHRYF